MTIAALQNVNAGIQDVLSGYETLKEQGRPGILPLIRELEALHTRHAAEIASLLGTLGEAVVEGMIQGIVNTASTTLRDWIGSLDADALSFVRRGEEMLLSTYETELESWDDDSGQQERQLLMAQVAEIRSQIAVISIV